MKIKRFAVLMLFFLSVFLQPIYADSPVWKIAKGEHHLFIGGTIHILTKSDYPLPSAFEKAYSQSTIIVFETDMQKMQPPEFQKKMMSRVIYSDGRNLKTVLNEDTFLSLERHLSVRGIPIVQFLNYKTGMVAITLTIIELQRLGLFGAGVDEFFNLRAINDQKALGQLETVEQQLAFIASMGDGQENEVIAYTLHEIKRLPEFLQSMKDAWRHGDNRKLKEVALTPIETNFPDVYDEIVVKRNKAWIPAIEAMLNTGDVEFILVGALHLVGDDGLLSLLISRGCTIGQP